MAVLETGNLRNDRGSRAKLLASGLFFSHPGMFFMFRIMLFLGCTGAVVQEVRLYKIDVD